MKHTDKPMDIHLMIENADTWAPQYAELGCYSVTFHVEAARRRSGWRVSCAGSVRGRRWR